MKGIVFTEFTEMVESRYGLGVLDDLLMACDLPSKGIYTSVGTYDHHELVMLLVTFSKQKQIPLPKLLEDFGIYLFRSFSRLYPLLFEKPGNVLDFLESVENYIHVEVRKLYPDAELPRFICEHRDERSLTLIYISDKSMADLAVGLIKGALAYYDEQGVVKCIPATENNSTRLIIELV